MVPGAARTPGRARRVDPLAGDRGIALGAPISRSQHPLIPLPRRIGEGPAGGIAGGVRCRGNGSAAGWDRAW